MTSRRSLLKGLGVVGTAFGLAWWTSRDPFPYSGCACAPYYPPTRDFYPVFSHMVAEGIEAGGVPDRSLGRSR